MDADGYILLGKDHGRNPYWHFPQGGVIKNESIERALAREVWEEVGLRPSDYNIVARLPGLRYKYPANHRKITRWVGQEQTYFLVRCKTGRPSTALHRGPEFANPKWVLLQAVREEKCHSSRTTSWKCSPNSKEKSLRTPSLNSSESPQPPTAPLRKSASYGPLTLQHKLLIR